MKLTEKDKKEVLKFLSKHKLMSLGTYYKLPWSACVYYLFDEDFNLYFVSGIKTIHSQNISKNGKVSLTIVDSRQDPKGKKVGLQARGIAKAINSAEELKQIIIAWNKRGFVPVTYKLFMKAWKSRFYKIKLTDIKMFDQNKPKEEEDRMWKI